MKEESKSRPARMEKKAKDEQKNSSHQDLYTPLSTLVAVDVPLRGEL
jgi:hypothetical protein